MYINQVKEENNYGGGDGDEPKIQKEEKVKCVEVKKVRQKSRNYSCSRLLSLFYEDKRLRWMWRVGLCIVLVCLKNVVFVGV